MLIKCDPVSGGMEQIADLKDSERLVYCDLKAADLKAADLENWPRVSYPYPSTPRTDQPKSSLGHEHGCAAGELGMVSGGIGI